MKRQISFDFEDDNVKSYIEENVGIIDVKKNVFEILTDLGESGDLLDLFKIAENDPNIDYLLFLNEPGCFSETVYDLFLDKILKKEANQNKYKRKYDPDIRTLYEKHINILKNFITRMLEFNKLIIAGLQGSIVTPFFGASLAADFRFASEDLRFSLCHVKYGLPPCGALPFFLPRYIGQNKAAEILFQGKEINAKEARKLGLVSHVFSKNVFKNQCVREIKSMKLNLESVKNTKKLMCNFKNELNHYFIYESKLILY